MTRRLIIASLSVLLLLTTFSCQKELSWNDANENETNPDPADSTINSSCNNEVMYLTKRYDPDDDSIYISVSYDANNRVSNIRMNTFLSEHRNITLLYDGDRVTSGVLRYNEDEKILDTAVFHYNSNNLIDSMYLKNSPGFELKFSYNTDGFMTKVVRYTDPGDTSYYYNLYSTGSGNIGLTEEYWNHNGTFEWRSEAELEWDDRKNPFEHLVMYMYYLDDEYQIFRISGPNNYVNESLVLEELPGTVTIVGNKFNYNNNCYPASSFTTLYGYTVLPEPDVKYDYK